jgi:ABC-2 type transport system permease protein
LVAALGLGLVVSATAQTQLQAILFTFALTLPSILLSGFFFERELMPTVMQWIGLAIPLTYFLEILRGIVLRGAGLDALWPQVVAMVALGSFLIVVATIRFARSTS